MGSPGSSLNNRETLPTVANQVYCTSSSYYQVTALVIEEICLGSEGCIRCGEEGYLWVSVPGNLQSELGWCFINSLCLTSSIWTAVNPAKTLQKLCQLKEARQNVVWLP